MVCQGSAEGGSVESESGGSGAERRLLSAGFAGNETGSIGSGCGVEGGGSSIVGIGSGSGVKGVSEAEGGDRSVVAVGDGTVGGTSGCKSVVSETISKGPKLMVCFKI